jgi:hypothetical protein
LDFTFINADEDKPAFPYSNLDSHTFDLPLGYEFNVKVSGTPGCHDDIESVVITTKAPDFDKEQRESTEPYAAFGDDVNNIGDYNGRTMVSGTYEMTAEAYSRDGVEGCLLAKKTIKFYADPTDPTPTKAPAKAPTDIPSCGIKFRLYKEGDDVNSDPRQLLYDGDYLNPPPFYGKFNIEALPEGCGNVRKVIFQMTGPISVSNKQESSAPYAIFGDRNGKFEGKDWRNGDYTVKATAYDRDNQVVTEKEINFSVGGVPSVTADSSGGSSEETSGGPLARLRARIKAFLSGLFGRN